MEASELFDICRELAATQPSVRVTYRLHEILALCAAEGCRQRGGTFGNLFSQVSYLCKQLGMTAAQSRDLQTARRHTNRQQPVEPAEWLYDIRAVAQLASAVFRQAIPGYLRCLLPSGQRPMPKGLIFNRRYVRCIVKRVADVITVETADGELEVDYLNTAEGRDFAYLRRLLRPGMQINLLDCHQEKLPGGSVPLLTPGMVVVEPDFLIDISSLAACFTAYGHHPLLYTLFRFKERPNTQATLLGNFAGVALDDIVNSRAEATTAHSLRRSFREQALRFCACPDFDAQKFKVQAEEQERNIREAVDFLFPSTDSRTPLLEPSFVCERLGLQGRVDLMTSDMSLLVEQKSGKNMKIERQSHDSHGLQLESHYVQLLLYYGVLHYNFGLSDRQVDTRLLYSRYEAARGLLSVNYYKALLSQALLLRNQIVATEMLIARDGINRILPLLRTDIIYKDVPHDGYFHRFVLPEIAVFNNQLASLSMLERTYLERMLTFVYREQMAQKLGSSSARLHHSGGCTADLWLMPLQEKLDTGNIMMGLEVIGCEGTNQVRLRICQPQVSNGTIVAAPNFRQGDMVYLYSYADTPDVRHSILYKGALQELADSYLVVSLNNGQHDTTVFTADGTKLWAVEHGGSDTRTSADIRSLYRFICADKRKRALLLGQRAPESDMTKKLSRSYHPTYDDVLLRIRQSSDYFLLIGPPGTGKTSMALRFMVEEETEGGVLLTAFTNRAIDEICAMLCETGRPFLRIGKETSCDERFRGYLLDTVLASTHTLEEARRLIDRTPVIVATTSMLQSQPFILDLKHFALAIVDEASQILEPGIIGLLASHAIDRFVLVGDHKQLPAVVQQEYGQTVVTEQCLIDIGLEDCRQSLFERLLRWEQQQGRSQFIGVLHAHGRMHPEVASFPLRHFYDREHLSPVPLPHQQECSLGYRVPAVDDLDRQLLSRRVLFLPTPVVRDTDGVGDTDYATEVAEARLVADVLRRIYRFTVSAFDPLKTVGVIVPYRRQISLIRQFLDEPLLAVCIDTVERYQGSQRDVIIYSFAVSRRFQLDFLTASTFSDTDGTLVDRKLNVALTRARRQMIVTGRPDILSSVPLFRQLVEWYGNS